MVNLCGENTLVWSIFVEKSGVQIHLLGLRPAAMKGVAMSLLHVALHRNLLYLGSDHTKCVAGLQSRLAQL